MHFKSLLIKPIAKLFSTPSSQIGIYNVVANSAAVVAYFFPYYIRENVADSIHFLELAIIGLPALFYIPIGFILSIFGLFRVLVDLFKGLRNDDLKFVTIALNGFCLNLLALSLLLLWRMVLLNVPRWLYSY